MSRSLLFSALGVCAILSSACDDSKEPVAAEDHSPVRVTFAVNGAAMTTDTLFLPAGQTVTVRATFYNAADDNLDDVETEHFSLLTFIPAGLATATIDAAHHYTHTVQVQGAAGTVGDVDIGYGHDALADEHTLTAKVKIQ
jgi:hypothetical protein